MERYERWATPATFNEAPSHHVLCVYVHIRARRGDTLDTKQLPGLGDFELYRPPSPFDAGWVGDMIWVHLKLGPHKTDAICFYFKYFNEPTNLNSKILPDPEKTSQQLISFQCRSKIARSSQVWTLPAPTLLGKLDLLRQSWRLNKVLDDAAELRSKIKDRTGPWHHGVS